MDLTVEQWRAWFDDATKTDPDTIEQLQWLCEEMHEVVCAKGHKLGCADPEPAPDDWNGWVDVLAARRAAFWWMTVGAELALQEDEPDPMDLASCHSGHVPPDTTSRMRMT